MSTAVTAAARVRRAAIDVVDVSDNVTTYPVRTEHVQYELTVMYSTYVTLTR